MTYRLQLTPTGWRILRDGREVAGGSMADVAEARKAVREMNKEAECK
jgi:hypothetical protein